MKFVNIQSASHGRRGSFLSATSHGGSSYRSRLELESAEQQSDAAISNIKSQLEYLARESSTLPEDVGNVSMTQYATYLHECGVRSEDLTHVKRDSALTYSKDSPMTRPLVSSSNLSDDNDSVNFNMHFGESFSPPIRSSNTPKSSTGVSPLQMVRNFNANIPPLSPFRTQKSSMFGGEKTLSGSTFPRSVRNKNTSANMHVVHADPKVEALGPSLTE